jgi:hypothetical protein
MQGVLHAYDATLLLYYTNQHLRPAKLLLVKAMLIGKIKLVGSRDLVEMQTITLMTLMELLRNDHDSQKYHIRVKNSQKLSRAALD